MFKLSKNVRVFIHPPTPPPPPCTTVGVRISFYVSYLELTSRVSDRRTLTKLRISNHKLMIELGRYNNTPRDNRLCPVCDCNTTEDEIHFLFYCSKYATITDNFYKKIQPIIQNVSRLPVPDLILELMNSSDYFDIIQFLYDIHLVLIHVPKCYQCN